MSGLLISSRYDSPKVLPEDANLNPTIIRNTDMV